MPWGKPNRPGYFWEWNGVDELSLCEVINTERGLAVYGLMDPMTLLVDRKHEMGYQYKMITPPETPNMLYLEEDL